MTALRTLLDRGRGDLLIPELHRLYGGGLSFSKVPADRPFTITNSVATIEGLTSFSIPGHAGGGEISDGNPQDRFVMGLLRALADAVAVGAGTLRAENRHLWTPAFICPESADLYVRLWESLGKRHLNPINIFVTGSGKVLAEDRSAPEVFHSPDVETILLTTEAGKRRLTREFTDIPMPHVLAFGESGTVDLEAAFRHLRRSWDIGVLLVEGGAMLNGAIFNAGLYDEIFMTVAPVLIGSSAEHPRPPFAQGFARTPDDAIRHEVVSVKSAGDYLYKRYARLGGSDR